MNCKLMNQCKPIRFGLEQAQLKPKRIYLVNLRNSTWLLMSDKHPNARLRNPSDAFGLPHVLLSCDKECKSIV